MKIHGPFFLDYFISLADNICTLEHISPVYMELALGVDIGYLDRVARRDLEPGEVYPNLSAMALLRLLYKIPGLVHQSVAISRGLAGPKWKPASCRFSWADLSHSPNK